MQDGNQTLTIIANKAYPTLQNAADQYFVEFYEVSEENQRLATSVPSYPAFMYNPCVLSLQNPGTFVYAGLCFWLNYDSSHLIRAAKVGLS